MANKVISSFDIGTGDNYTLSVPYGKCSTAADAVAKTVSVDGQFALEAGAIVAVRFAATNSATSPTLNVNGTGAKAIYYQGAPITPAYLKVNYTYQFIYNGGQWDLIGEIDTKNSGTVVAVVAGNGLTGGGPNGTVTVDVGAGNGITVSANAVSAKAGTGITVDSTGINNAGVRSITQDSTDGHKLTIDTGGSSTTITIPDTNTDTTYSAGTGLSLSGTTFNHSNSVTAGTAAGSANNTELTYGGSFTVPTITYDAQGHITAKGTRTMRMPAKVTAADLGLSAVMKFLGTSATAITDGATTNPITIGTTSTTVTSGNVVLYSGKEFVWTGSAWEELGNEGSHALKTITISAGNGLTGGGTLEANRTISHADTSSQASITANGRKYITGVTLDTYGHVTGLTTGTETVTNTDTNYYHTPSYTSTATSTLTGGGTTNLKIATGTGVNDMYIPVATATTAGATIVYPADSCTTFSSDSGTVTPKAVQKGAKLFAYERLADSGVTANGIPRLTKSAVTVSGVTYSGLENTGIQIESVTNTKDTSKKANVLVIPAEGGKKMVYGYCTDQTDGTSFIGGVFDASATTYPYASGLAIGGTSGNLLWKGKQVATTDMISTFSGNYNDLTNKPTIPTVNNATLTIQKNGTTVKTFTANASSNVTANITVPTKVSELTNDSGFKTTDNNTTYTFASGTTKGAFSVTPSGGSAQSVSIYGLATVATSGSYNDLTNKPTIPSAYTLPNATSSVLGGVKIGSNITVSSGTISLTKSNVTSALGYTPPTSDTNNAVTMTKNTGAKYYVCGTTSASTTTGGQIFDTGVYVDTTAGKFVATSVYGAVWNDYAEYRQSDITEAGRVICENGDDTLSLATERLQPGANVVSDTFGFAIGETDECKTPVAVSGRVLVYPYEDRESYKPGDAVCAAPNGTVSKMTREEIREYPERIIGTVSAIPSYETWGTGNVKVNGRIWVKVK